MKGSSDLQKTEGKKGRSFRTRLPSMSPALVTSDRLSSILFTVRTCGYSWQRRMPAMEDVDART